MYEIEKGRQAAGIIGNEIVDDKTVCFRFTDGGIVYGIHSAWTCYYS